MDIWIWPSLRCNKRYGETHETSAVSWPNKLLRTKAALGRILRHKQLGLHPLLRPWPNDQTLFVKYSRFAYQTQSLSDWPYHKTLLEKHFLFDSSIECFWSFSRTLLKEFSLSIKVLRRGQTLLAKRNLKCLTNNVWQFGLLTCRKQ